MMATKVVSFREDEEILEYIRQQGLNPNEVAKAALEKEVQRIRAMGALEWLKQNPLGPLGKPAEQIIREMRDQR